jgi:hypothetical protein
MAIAARRRRRSFGSRDEMRAHYRSRGPLSQLGADILDAYLQWGTIERRDGVHLACDPDTEAPIFEMSTTAHGAPAAWDHLAHLSCPALIVAGADSFLPDIFGQQADRADAAPLTLPGGHFVLHEDTARTAALIRQRVIARPATAPRTGGYP